MLEVNKKRFPWSIAISATVFLLIDIILKQLALHQFFKQSISPIKLELFLNTGIVFSLPVPKSIYIPIASLILLVLLYLLVDNIRKEKTFVPGLLLIILGAASNLWDNLRFGATIDYLILFNYSAINLADLMIAGGIILLLIKIRKK